MFSPPPARAAQSHQVCDQYIKPATAARACCFTNLVIGDDGEPIGGDLLLGKATCFISHWWGYRFLDLIAIVREHENALKAAGEPPAAYFLDMLLLNQHRLKREFEDESKREKLTDALRDCLKACGRVVLCCAAGPSGVGWESPAPLGRIWCLYEIYVAITEDDVQITMQLGPSDAIQFRQAVNKDGLARVERALAAVNARDASATMPEDLATILGEIDTKLGMERFNALVREGMLKEYQRIAMTGMR